MFDDVELTAADIRRLAAEARPLIRSRGRWVELDRVDLKEAAAALAERADHDPAHRRRDPAPRRRPRGLAAGRRRSPSRAAGWATDLLARAQRRLHRARHRRPRASPASCAATRPRRWPGSASSTPPSSAAASPSTWASARRPPCSPTSARDRAATARRWSSPRRPSSATGRRRPQRFTPEPAGRRPPRRHPGVGRRARRPRSRGADVVITTYGTAVRDIDALGRARRGTGSSSTRPRPSRTRPATPPSSCGASTPAAAWPSPARRSRTASATCGPSSTSPTPASSGPRRRSSSQLSRRGRGSALRALNGILVFRRTKSEPEVAAELPDKIDELDHCTMTPEQIGLYQAVLDRLVRQRRRGRASRGRATSSPPSPPSSRSATTPPPTRTTAARSPGGRASWPGSRRSSTSVFAAGEQVLVFTHFAEWGKKLADHLTAAHRRARSTATTAAWPGAPATSWSPTSRPARARARWCCRSRPAAPGSTSPPPATSCSTTAGGTPRSRTRPATGRGASARPAPSSPTGWCAPARSTSGSRRSSPASATSPTSCCPSRARWPTSTPTSCGSPSASGPTSLLTEDAS